MVLIQCCLFGKDQPEPSEHDEDSDEASESSETEEVADASVPPPSAVATTSAAPAAAKPLPKGMGRVLSGPGPEVRVEWNARRWGRTLGLMFRRDALRDYGRNFKEAISKLNHNIPPQQSGSKSEGMGAAMRIGNSLSLSCGVCVCVCVACEANWLVWIVLMYCTIRCAGSAVSQ